jgi:hypothetical protein
MGIESPANSSDNDTVSISKSGANDSQNGRIDPDLARVVERWDALPEAIRAGIVAMVKAASAG